MRSFPLSLFWTLYGCVANTLKFSVLRSASNDSSCVCNPRLASVQAPCLGELKTCVLGGESCVPGCWCVVHDPDRDTDSQIGD
jgi:hypothetical protein